jgi:hypothetical protein
MLNHTSRMRPANNPRSDAVDFYSGGTWLESRPGTPAVVSDFRSGSLIRSRPLPCVPRRPVFLPSNSVFSLDAEKASLNNQQGKENWKRDHFAVCGTDAGL